MFADELLFVFFKAAEYPVGHIDAARYFADTDAETRIVLRAQRRFDRLETVMTARAATRTDTRSSDRQRDIIDNYEHMLRNVELRLAEQSSDCGAAAIHVRHRLDEQNILVLETTFRRDSIAIAAEFVEVPFLLKLIE